jgi:hypothetical protein
LRALSLCTCCRLYPGTATGGTALLIRPVMSAFPERVAGSACASSFSRLAQRSLALRPAHSRCHQFVARLPEGFRHIVTSMPAPVASGWSGCRAGLAPAGKRRLFTAHTQRRHTCRSKADAQISRNVQVEWTSRPPFAVIQITRERDIAATGKRTLSTLSWCGSRNAFVRPGRWPARRPSWSGFRHLPRLP